MEEMGYIQANMIVWLDETGSDRRNAEKVLTSFKRYDTNRF